MHTQTLKIGSQDIAYYESAGTGPAALLIHGNSSSGLSFQHQLAGQVGSKHRLVAIDLPGHGRSQPVPNPEPTLGLQGYAHIVTEIVPKLGLDSAVLVGWSLGGHVALEAVGELRGIKGVMIFGTPPVAFPPAMAEAFLPHPAMAASFKADLSEDEMDAYVAAFFKPDTKEIPAVFGADIRRTDGRARAAVASSIRPGGYKDEVQVVANLTIPVAILHGEQEQLVNGAYFAPLKIPTLWRGKVQVIPEAGHAPHWEQPGQFNSLLETFIQECSA